LRFDENIVERVFLLIEAMKIFTLLECVTDFPDHRIEDGSKVVEPGGRAAACAVSDLPKRAGMIL